MQNFRKRDKEEGEGPLIGWVQALQAPVGGTG